MDDVDGPAQLTKLEADQGNSASARTSTSKGGLMPVPIPESALTRFGHSCDDGNDADSGASVNDVESIEGLDSGGIDGIDDSQAESVADVNAPSDAPDRQDCVPDASVAPQAPAFSLAEPEQLVLQGAQSLRQHQSPPDVAAAVAEDDESSVSSTNGVDDTTEKWHMHKKHFFIISSSGKPVYSHHGDENALAGLTALITALVSVVEDQGDKIHHVVSGATTVAFRVQGPLYLVATSSKGEPVMALQRQLELLYNQVVLIVTKGLERIIQRNPAYDVRNMLDGVENVLTPLIHMVQRDPSYLLSAVQLLPMPAGDRSIVSELLADAVKASGAYYGLVMASEQAIAVEASKGQPPWDPTDVLLLSNFVTCNKAYRNNHGEAFCPVCLPHYNDSAYLHAYIHYLDSAAGVYLVLLAGSSDAFHRLSQARAQLEHSLQSFGILGRLKRLLQGATGAGRLSVESLPRPLLGGRFGARPLWHFMLVFPHKSQLVMPSLSTEPFSSPQSQQDLALSYANLINLAWDGSRPNQMVWLGQARMSMLSWIGKDVELYMVFDPLTDKATALKTCDALRKHFAERHVQADLLLQG